MICFPWFLKVSKDEARWASLERELHHGCAPPWFLPSGQGVLPAPAPGEDLLLRSSALCLSKHAENWAVNVPKVLFSIYILAISCRKMLPSVSSLCILLYAVQGNETIKFLLKTKTKHFLLLPPLSPHDIPTTLK